MPNENTGPEIQHALTQKSTKELLEVLAKHQHDHSASSIVHVKEILKSRGIADSEIKEACDTYNAAVARDQRDLAISNRMWMRALFALIGCAIVAAFKSCIG